MTCFQYQHAPRTASVPSVLPERFVLQRLRTASSASGHSWELPRHHSWEQRTMKDAVGDPDMGVCACSDTGVEEEDSSRL